MTNHFQSLTALAGGVTELRGPVSLGGETYLSKGRRGHFRMKMQKYPVETQQTSGRDLVDGRWPFV